MKKAISISLTLLILTAMLHLSVATHYCGGKIAASIISLNSKLASCGMEGEDKDYHAQETQVTSHCCDNVVTNYAIDKEYAPSYSITPEFFQNISKVFSFTSWLPFHSSEILISTYTNVNPPGVLMSTSVDLSGICVFRI